MENHWTTKKIEKLQKYQDLAWEQRKKRNLMVRILVIILFALESMQKRKKKKNKKSKLENRD